MQRSRRRLKHHNAYLVDHRHSLKIRNDSALTLRQSVSRVQDWDGIQEGVLALPSSAEKNALWFALVVGRSCVAGTADFMQLLLALIELNLRGKSMNSSVHNVIANGKAEAATKKLVSKITPDAPNMEACMMHATFRLSSLQHQ